VTMENNCELEHYAKTEEKQRESQYSRANCSTPDPAPVWLTATEAAQYLRVEPRTLLLWTRQGKVKGHILSGTQRVTWRFRTVDLAWHQQ